MLCSWYWCVYFTYIYIFIYKYIYRQLLEIFAGRHVDDSLLTCTAAMCILRVVVSLLNMHIYPCNSWPSLSSRSCWALFWYLVGIVIRIIFPPELLHLSTRNPNSVSLLGATLPFPVSAPPLSDSRSALSSCTWSSCWWLKSCHLWGQVCNTWAGRDCPRRWGEAYAFLNSLNTAPHFKSAGYANSGGAQNSFSSCLDRLVLAKTSK